MQPICSDLTPAWTVRWAALSNMQLLASLYCRCDLSVLELDTLLFKMDRS